MKIPRQGERRARFLAALNDMPRLETWTTSHRVDTGLKNEEGEPVIETVERNHTKLIRRRVRRDMARQLSRRQYRADRNLPEPR